MVLPVARRAQESGHEVTLIALTTALQPALASGVRSIGYANLWHLAGPDARRFGERLCPAVSERDPVPPEESIAYHGINFAELVECEGLERATARYTRDGRHAFLPVRFMKRVLQDLHPDIVIATNSPRSEQAAIVAAREVDIPAICMVDLFALQEIQWIGAPGYADRICVLNDAVRQFFIKHGRHEQEVAVTGNPAFDALGDPAARAAGRQLRATRGWNDGKLNILWASQVEPEMHPFDDRRGDPELPRKVELCLRQLVGEDERLRLVVRYHPSEQVAFQEAPSIAFSPISEELPAVLHAVDLVVVTASTVGLEAHLAGKPVISVDMSVITPDAPYARMGISLGVESLGALAAEIKKWAGEVSRTPLSAPPAAAPIQGSAADNILRVIENLANLRRSKK
jgi:hypothetical protein